MLTIKRTDKPLCVVTEGKTKGTIVYYDDKTSDSPNPLKKKLETEITTETGKFFPICTVGTRHCVFISGPSGSGKSTWMADYVKMYLSIFPDNDVYLFSRIKNDPKDPLYPLIKKGDITQEVLGPKIYEQPIQLKDVKDSLVIFDDIEGIDDPDIAAELKILQNDILHLGRHENTYCISSTHLGLDRDKTRVLLNESHGVVIFPMGGNPNMVRSLLKTYVGLDRHQTDKIMQSHSRWCYINKCYPMYVITDKKIYLL